MSDDVNVNILLQRSKDKTLRWAFRTSRSTSVCRCFSPRQDKCRHTFLLSCGMWHGKDTEKTLGVTVSSSWLCGLAEVVKPANTRERKKETVRTKHSTSVCVGVADTQKEKGVESPSKMGVEVSHSFTPEFSILSFNNLHGTRLSHRWVSIRTVLCCLDDYKWRFDQNPVPWGNFEVKTRRQKSLIYCNIL